MVLIAHEDQDVCRQILSRLERLPVSIRVCGNPHEVARELDGDIPCLLLLDVAFTGGFPFALIDRAKQQQGDVDHKIILFPSIYNKTAYKKQPTSLYGADRYLELHHISDSLLEVIGELFPQLKGAIFTDQVEDTIGGERNLLQADLAERTLALCRLLIADIALYHQERLHSGLKKNEARDIFDDILQEGRQLLLRRLPEAKEIADEYLLLAFDEFYDAYLFHRLGS